MAAFRAVLVSPYVGASDSILYKVPPRTYALTTIVSMALQLKPIKTTDAFSQLVRVWHYNSSQSSQSSQSRVLTRSRSVASTLPALAWRYLQHKSNVVTPLHTGCLGCGLVRTPGTQRVGWLYGILGLYI